MQPGSERHIFSVSELNRDVRTLLEQGFPLLWLEGEISNFARPSSGHWYLSLKDSKAQIRCAMFRQRNRLVDFTPGDGMQVLVRARVSLYEPRGDFQLIIEHMEEAGNGALQRAFEELKARLNREGLFDSSHKKPLPRWPGRIGVITSPTGAAIRDILSTLKRRFPACPVLLYPVAVQGERAAAEIVQALRLADERKDCDVLILSRGGGSLEDLWPFNEEQVARAVYDCELPVVCGVGHEIDFTIADFVADQRAPTPTAAAELVSQDQQHLLQQLEHYDNRLLNRARALLNQHREKLTGLQARLKHPRHAMERQAQRLDELEQRLKRSQQIILDQAHNRLDKNHGRLQQHSPTQRLDQLGDRLHYLQQRLIHQHQHLQQQKTQQLAALSRSLHAVSPLATLERGYAIVTQSTTDQVVRTSTEVALGEKLDTRLAKGRIRCSVDEILE